MLEDRPFRAGRSMRRSSVAPALGMLLLLALVAPHVAHAADPAARLAEARAALYDRGDVDAASRAAQGVLATEPGSAGAHEILGLVAVLRGDEDAAFTHMLAAVRDPGSDATRAHLVLLDGLHDDPESWRKAARALEEAADAMPNPADAALARTVASRHLFRLGEIDDAAALLAGLGLLGDWQVVAGFENDQMKGFDVAYGPERDGVDLAAVYQGQQRSIGWRHIETLDEQGRVPHIQLQSPNNWSVAYMATWVHSDEARDAELRITTAEPVKAWVNGGLVASARYVEWARFDQIVVPVRLEQGWNALLVKSCQDKGEWETAVRFTAPGGAVAEGLRASATPQRAPTTTPARAFGVDEDVLGRLAAISNPSRRAFFEALALSTEGFPKLASERFDALLKTSKSPLALLHGAFAAWDAGEDEKMLERFARGVKAFPALPVFLYQRARYFQEKERYDRALEDVEAALALSPDYRDAQRRKARIYRQKGWTEEACKAFERIDAADPDHPDVLTQLAACAKSRSRFEEARELYQRLADAWRTDRGAIEELARLEERRERYGAAIELYEQLIEIYPYRTDPYLALGAVHRSQQQWDEAAAAFMAASNRDPEYAWPHELLGDLYMEQGRPADAANAWRRSLELNPEDHVLWERVELLEPDGADLLAPHVPDDEELDAVLASAGKVEVFPGASYVMLLDHEAMQLHPDGSLRRVVTMVVRIEDESGRDRFSTHNLPQDGHLRVRRAFVADPEGRRQEVSSLRNRTIRFQDLRPGSTIVLQYRHDAFQQTFLNNHWHGTWFFQQDTGQGERAQWTVVVPKDRALKVHVQGPVKEEKGADGDHLVYHYTANHVPPLRMEQQTLPLTDLAALVSATTLPDWDFFARWEWSMVEDSLRLTPDLEQKAREVIAMEAPPQEKVDAVYRFVANDVRYMQDYEERIAGVRPHPASLTYERRYGDCKDKVVLMMMLLRALDVDARFAMLSTFSRGKLMKGAPSQQFNHAIVYVPAQEGIAAERFYDPTAEHLDRGNLRWDDQGRTALVLREDGWDFIEIPFDPPEFEVQSVSADLQLAGPDEPSRVKVVLMARGRTAAGMRKALTNDETARRMIEGFTCGYLFPGARLLDYGVEGATDIVEPVKITAEIAAPNIVRAEDRTLRMDVLDYARVASKYGKWKERRHPISFGPPDKVEVTLNATPPAGYKVERLPSDATIEGPCLTLTLSAEKTGEGGAKVHYTMVRSCAELPAEQYDALRDTTLRISRALSEPVVFKR